VAVTGMEFPGGRSRKSCRLLLADGRSVIATRRSDRRAVTESEILRRLQEHAAPVPQWLAFDGKLLIQEDLGGERLSQALAKASAAAIEQLLDAALTSLAAVQQAGSAAGLDEYLPRLGASEEWLIGLLRRPAVIGEHFGLPAPELRLDDLLDLLRIAQPRFIKWDARPGNAIVRPGGDLATSGVAWFDWEHCGARNRLDDLAWLLGDEFTPDLPLIEARLLERHLAAFADAKDSAQARTYLFAYGVFHMSVRLGLILSNKKDKPWWDWEYCLRGDKVGVTLEATQRTCRRASRWAAQTPLTEPLAPWFERLAERLAEL
jgi:hypothetical protein